MNNLGNKEIMAKNIQHYLDLKGIDRNEMCRDLGFNLICQKSSTS